MKTAREKWKCDVWISLTARTVCGEPEISNELGARLDKCSDVMQNSLKELFDNSRGDMTPTEFVEMLEKVVLK